MGWGIPFKGCNRDLQAPEGYEETIASLPTFNNGRVSVSRWQLDPSEIEEVVRTGCIFLSVMSGPSMPPVYVGSEENTRAVVQDCGGVWKK